MGVNGHWYIEIDKQAYWRGNQHVWTNRYIMSGSQPSAEDGADVAVDIHDIENGIYPVTAAGDGAGFTQARVYGSGKGGPIATIGYNESLEPASATGFTGASWAGAGITWADTLEVCILLETPINGLSSTGKPIYLRKYYRGLSSGNNEPFQNGVVSPADIAGIEAATLDFKTGIGSNSWVVIAASGNQASGPPTVQPHLVNHQIPRGRKKKKASSSLISTLETIAIHAAASGAGTLIAESL